MSTLKVTNVAHETSTLNTLVFDNGGGSGNGRVTTKELSEKYLLSPTHLQLL